MKSLYSERSKVLNYISKQLLGPFGGEDERLTTDSPNLRYLLGTLYPKDTEQDQVQKDQNQDNSNIASDSDQASLDQLNRVIYVSSFSKTSCFNRFELLCRKNDFN